MVNDVSTTEQVNDRLLLYVIDNAPATRTLLRQLYLEILGDENRLRVENRFDSISECINDIEHHPGRKADIISCDLVSHDGGRKQEDVFNLIMGEGIPALKRLRRLVGTQTILVVVSKYPDWFTDQSMRAAIGDALNANALADVVIPKMPLANREEKNERVSDALRRLRSLVAKRQKVRGRTKE